MAQNPGRDPGQSRPCVAIFGPADFVFDVGRCMGYCWFTDMPMERIMIEKNIPIPEIANNGRPNKYPLANLEVGDCFFWAYEANRSKKTIRNAAHEHGKRFGKTFVSRSEKTGVRVWRTE